MKDGAFITGLGIVSPIGIGKDAFLAGLRSARCGLGRLQDIDAAQFRVGAAGEVLDLDWQSGWDRNVGRAAAFALRACREALTDAGLGDRPLPSDTALALGSGAGEMRAMEQTLGPHEEAIRLDVPDPLQPPSAITAKVADSLGLSGRLLTFINACAAGAQAIAVAAEYVRSGRTSAAVAGGVEIVSRMVMSGFEALRAVSPTGCHPFDEQRDGIQLAELAAFVVLESGARVRERGALPYARVAGSGASADAFHVVRPDEAGAGAVLAIERALRDAGLAPEAIDYINAHGTGTVQNDPAELAALRQVFGERASKVPVSSTKSMLGHALGASGAAEVVIGALALRHGLLPATIGLRRPMEGYEGWDFVPATPREGVTIHNLASNAFAFGGNNVVLILSSVTK